MTVISNLEAVADWLRSEVCANLTFKEPNHEKTCDSYEYTLVHPDVHIMYVPTKDVLNSDRRVVPSVVVQFDNAKTYPKAHNGLMYFKLGFAVWNLGLHNDGEYTRNIEGWHDVWNFVDYTHAAILNAEFIGHIRVRFEDGIEVGPAKEQNAIADYYPFWYAYLNFTGEFAQAANHKKYNHLL